MGIINKSLFKGTKYVLVDSPEKADFVYLSVPKLNEEQFSRCPHREDLRESIPRGHGSSGRTWNSLTVDPFMAEPKEFKKLGLPMLSASPDLTVEAAVRGSTEKFFVLRQGSIAQAYRGNGRRSFRIWEAR
jgi:hypothetical protein